MVQSMATSQNTLTSFNPLPSTATLPAPRLRAKAASCSASPCGRRVDLSSRVIGSYLSSQMT